MGNRKQLTSTLAPVPAGLWNYDANDRFTAGDSYDNNGNTTASGGIGNVYDFENHLIQKGGVAIVYDGDGNRVSKTTASSTTKYLVDDYNPTGYAQVVAEEFPNGLNQAVYVYGLERISKAYYSTQFSSPQGFRYYVYDGHGSVRALADTSGNVTDTYDYDAFGNLIHSTFTSIPPLGNSVSPSPNNYLYSGEQFDPDLNLYYNRARYLNVSTGRFWSMDSFEGESSEPTSLHRYLYASDDPVNRLDPAGTEDIIEATAATGIQTSLSATLTTVLYRSVTGALGGAAFGAVTALLGGGDFKQSVIEGAISGAVLGPVAGAAGAYRAGRIILALISAGAGGAGAYRAYKGKQYALAAFYALTAFAGPLFAYLSQSAAVDEAAPLTQSEPITDPSRLLTDNPSENNPWAGDTFSTVTQEDRTYYRVYGESTQRVGGWLTPVEPTSGNLVQEGLALPPGNAANAYATVNVPAGTRIQLGIAGPNWGRAGGFPQIRLLQNIPGDNFVPSGPLQP